MKAILVVALFGCARPEVKSCDDDLHGVWKAPSGRWMLLDNGPTVEAFPLFDDGIPPRVIDLRRGERFTGEVKRRYMQRQAECIARAPIRIAKCTTNRLQIVVGDVLPPLAYSPCQWPKPNDSRLELWQRE